MKFSIIIPVKHINSYVRENIKIFKNNFTIIMVQSYQIFIIPMNIISKKNKNFLNW